MRDLPRPELGPEEVLVRMRLSPDPSDLHVIRARFGRQPALPATGGSEGVGTIEATGDSVRGLSAGTRVVLLNVPGTWQEFVVCPATNELSKAVAAQESILKLMASGSLKLPASAKYSIDRVQEALMATDGINSEGKPLLNFTTTGLTTIEVVAL